MSYGDVTDDEARRLIASRTIASNFDDAEIDDLESSAPIHLTTADTAREIASAEAKRAHQQNVLRGKFFRWVCWVVGGALAGNFALFSFYIRSQWGHISDSVMISWISASVIEVLGLAYIIARYLFEHAAPEAANQT